MNASTTRGRFRTILCPVDFSDSSRAALRYAAAIGHRAGGRLIVLYVNDPLFAAAAAIAYDRRGLASTARAELVRFVKGALGDEPALGLTYIVALGNPAREIRKAARRLRCDLVVVGTRGLGDASRLFFGSTTGRLLRTTDIPVLAVPRVSAGRTRGTVPRGWPTRVLAAVELGSHAAADARAAAGVSRWFKSHLMLVTVVEPLQPPSWLHLRGARDRTRIAAARARLRTLADAFDRDAVTVRVLSGDPAQQISAAAIDADAGLTVVMLRPSDRLLGTRQGSVTYRVLCDAAMPVLALPTASRARRLR